jgi:two-component system, OmpR family, phosphate regulon sensor histidine kinase PhoR
MSDSLILLALDDSPLRPLLERALHAAGYDVALAQDGKGLDKILIESTPTLAVLGEKFSGASGLEVSRAMLERFPTLPIILFAEKDDPELFKRGMRIGLRDVLTPPLRIDEIVTAIKNSESRAAQLGDWVRRQVKSTTSSLEQRISEMDTLVALGRTITGSLDPENVLVSVVTAAVKLTGAEEGNILLLNDETGELHMRASLNFEESFARTFRLPVQDTLAGQVIHSGQPVTFNADSPTKIKTSYLVQSLIYVPIRRYDKVLGVLGVDNRHKTDSFSSHHVLLLSILADYAAISMDNARLYQASETERAKLYTTLTNIGDGVIVLDETGAIILINPVAQRIFDVRQTGALGKKADAVIAHPDFLALLELGASNSPMAYQEINFEDGRVFNALFTPIPGIGAAVTMQEITQLKMLDRLKSDFIHTVSHDLRSPLTAILGYVELMGRVGPLTDQQQEFVSRVRTSVNSITTLVNDLLDLGRIEAGLDNLKEDVDLANILRYSVENLHNHITSKNLVIDVQAASNLPSLRGNPLRLRQLFDNLIGNAVKYTPANGKVSARLQYESEQIIFEVQDTGVGIPPTDQPHIFEKFYRASNAAENGTGTGLGLAIVKSIVDNHNGRIWVESAVGKGTKFVVVLPGLLNGASS